MFSDVIVVLRSAPQEPGSWSSVHLLNFKSLCIYQDFLNNCFWWNVHLCHLTVFDPLKAIIWSAVVNSICQGKYWHARLGMREFIRLVLKKLHETKIQSESFFQGICKIFLFIHLLCILNVEAQNLVEDPKNVFRNPSWMKAWRN